MRRDYHPSDRNRSILWQAQTSLLSAPLLFLISPSRYTLTQDRLLIETSHLLKWGVRSTSIELSRMKDVKIYRSWVQRLLGRADIEFIGQIGLTRLRNVRLTSALVNTLHRLSERFQL